MKPPSQSHTTSQQIDELYTVLRQHATAETRIYKELTEAVTREKRYTSGGFVDQEIRRKFVSQLALIDKNLFNGLWKFAKAGKAELAEHRSWALKEYFEWWSRLRGVIVIVSGVKIEPDIEHLGNAKRADYEVYKFPFWMTETERRGYLPFGIFYRRMDRWVGHSMRAKWGSQEPARSAVLENRLRANKTKEQIRSWYRQLRSQRKSQEACLEEIRGRLKTKECHRDYEFETIKRIVGMREVLIKKADS